MNRCMPTQATDRRRWRAVLLIGLTLLIAPSLSAQVRPGASYLKLYPGARQAGLSGAQAASLDDAAALFANPGAAGFLREWQWSAHYTNWISDLYNASLHYGRQVRTPWSNQRAGIGLGINYLGIPSFDSSELAATAYSGNDLLVTLSLGQPLALARHRLAVGANVKYLRSTLGPYEAATVAGDLGMLFRSRRFAFLTPGSGFLDDAIFSAGIAVTNIGNPLTFAVEKTPLPQTVRAGVALVAGTHHGFQLGVDADYQKIRAEQGFARIGAEISWRALLTLRAGYSFEDNLAGNVAFGTSLRLDDTFLALKSHIPGRNNALRFDLASQQSNDFTASPYNGSLTFYPIGPASFRLLEPAHAAKLESDSVRFAWEHAVDPDLFDQVKYRLLITPDSTLLAQILAAAGDDPSIFWEGASLPETVLAFSLDQPGYQVTDLHSGTYYWAVIAADRDLHLRMGETQNTTIMQFTILAPRLEITGIDFDYSPWITEDAHQGSLNIGIVNSGNRRATGFTLRLWDALAVAAPCPPGTDLTDNGGARLLAQLQIPEIAPGDSSAVEADWATPYPGLHSITAEVAASFPAAADNGARISRTESFYTIPKGRLVAPDSAVSENHSTTIWELPYVGKIFFDSSATQVKPEFISDWLIEPPLRTLATRLRLNANLSVSLRGTADPTSGETDVAVADERALAVRDSLLRFGVRPQQITLLPGELLEPRRLPANAEDTRWILEERRRVDVVPAPEDEEALFRPVEAVYTDHARVPVPLHVAIACAVPARVARLVGGAGHDDAIRTPLNSDSCEIDQRVDWLAPDDDARWIGQHAGFQVELEDSLGRTFRTPVQQTFLRAQTTSMQRMYFGIARFARTEPFYNFYWGNLLERVRFLREDKSARMRFVGHACAIGPDDVNQRLSKRRADEFQARFLKDLQEHNPALFDELKSRLDPPEAFGETRPFTFKREGGEAIVLGNNSTPMGRFLNRRIIFLIYSQK